LESSKTEIDQLKETIDKLSQNTDASKVEQLESRISDLMGK